MARLQTYLSQKWLGKRLLFGENLDKSAGAAVTLLLLLGDWTCARVRDLGLNSILLGDNAMLYRGRIISPD